VSFRIEEKILVEKNQTIEFKKLYHKKSLKKLYDSRVIKSLYFENTNNEMYKDSIEGCLPRKKIRVRSYPNSKSRSFFLEKKISSVEGRFKKKTEINEIDFKKLIKYGYHDNDYGFCKPLIYVEYLRHYYLINNARLTHDENIKYYRYKNKMIRNEENEIFEIKTNYKADLNELYLMFPMNRTRFSKYCNAYEKFFN
jgi:hypothetical protein